LNRREEKRREEKRREEKRREEKRREEKRREGYIILKNKRKRMLDRLYSKVYWNELSIGYCFI
jgi:hypothetical protein